MAKKPTPQPNEEQSAALLLFKLKHPLDWKTKLATAWIYGTDTKEPQGHLLRQIRNQCGPTWLAHAPG